jgi:HTH-type transcriptional regulator/antitoxin HigA
MGKNKDYKFEPNFAVPPGDTLIETLAELRMSQADLARRTGRPNKTINEIIKGLAQITPDTAIQFERALGIPANFWINLEYNYRESMARIKETEELKKQVELINLFPVKELQSNSWIPNLKEKTEIVKELLKFFGVSNLKFLDEYYQKYQMAVKQSKAYKVNKYAVYTWLRQGEILSKKIHTNKFNEKKFKANLSEARGLIQSDPDYFISPLLRATNRFLKTIHEHLALEDVI